MKNNLLSAIAIIGCVAAFATIFLPSDTIQYRISFAVLLIVGAFGIGIYLKNSFKKSR